MAKVGAKDQMPHGMPCSSASTRLRRVQRARLAGAAWVLGANSAREGGRAAGRVGVAAGAELGQEERAAGGAAPAGDRGEPGPELGLGSWTRVPGGAEPVGRVAGLPLTEPGLALEGELGRPVVMDADDQVAFGLGQAQVVQEVGVVVAAGAEQ